ncbi:MAG: ATP-binding cassette domain-containing protein [Pseudomonadales bacterium]|nr:ATP-binding cassette domain-containing protein [Pseudomonadales bacterium]
MINFTDVGLQRGVKTLFNGATLAIYPGQKIGLVGANGCGKSSLLKLLSGELVPDTGDLNVPGGWRIAHMAQEVAASSRSAVDYVLDGDSELRQVESSLDILEQQPYTEQTGHELAALHQRYDELDGYTARSRAEALLLGLGFAMHELENPLSSFSGGWRIRLNLAQALMCPSELLLLDEPTNHLDLDALFWLEQWLKRYEGTLLMISHDRDFLDAVVDSIVAIEQQQVTLYKGGYSAYERQKAERLAQQQAAFEKQQRRKQEIENFVRRFRAKATKARQAQSRLKELERMEEISAAHIDSPFSFSIPAPEKTGSELLRIDDGQIGYGDKTILSRINLGIYPGSRLGLLGANGSGKSTLIKVLAGKVALMSGARVVGQHLAMGYFDQHQVDALDDSASPLLHLQRISPKATEQSIRNFLGGFDFHGDQALDPITHFSGGEKARLALAMVVWQKPNLLLLDEPTNHLDLEMRHALTVALQAYEGALVLVSHDRNLLKNTVDQFLLVDQGKVEEFAGDLDTYRQWLLNNKRTVGYIVNSKTGKDEAALLAASVTEAAVTAPSRNGQPDRKTQRQQAARLRASLKPLQDEMKTLEKAMEKTSRRLHELEQILLEPGLYEADNKEKLALLLKEQGELKLGLLRSEEEWLEVSEQLEQLSS